MNKHCEHDDELAQTLRDITAWTETWEVECDGGARLVHMALEEASIPHVVYAGQVRFFANQSRVMDSVLHPHFWVVTESGFYIDYWLRSWIMEPEITPHPHGVFLHEDHNYLRYEAVYPLRPKMSDCEAVFKACMPGAFDAIIQKVMGCGRAGVPA